MRLLGDWAGLNLASGLLHRRPTWLIAEEGQRHNGHAMIGSLVQAVRPTVAQERPCLGVPEDIILGTQCARVSEMAQLLQRRKPLFSTSATHLRQPLHNLQP